MPAVLSLAIMIPLLVTLFKLRRYRSEFGMQLDMKKVLVNLSVCLIIFIYYTLRVVLMMSWTSMVLA